MDLLNLGLNTTGGKLYFLAVDTRDRLEIQFVPERLSKRRSSDLHTVHIVGRNTPRYQQVGGETRLQFMLDFYADESSRQSVLAKCNWLEALTYTDGNKKPAQRVSLVFGEMFKKELWMVRDVDPVFSGFHKQFGFLPQQAQVNISLCLDVDTNLRWEDVAPAYSPGTPDGYNPVSLGQAVESNDNDAYLSITSGNSFQEILNRALQRLRIG